MTTLSDKIAEVENLIARATPGPWQQGNANGCRLDCVFINGVSPGGVGERDAALIAAAPTMIASMLEVVREAHILVNSEGYVESWDFNRLEKALEKFASTEGGG